MATLVLQAAGTALGGMIGGPAGALVGRMLGAAAGGLIDQSLLGNQQRAQGPRPRGLEGLSSGEGQPLPRVFGKARVGGQLIWATRFDSVRRKQRAKGGSATGSQTAQITYYANVALALAEGPIGRVRRVWADGRELDTNHLTMRVHTGAEDQQPDPLIVAKEGVANAPSYRGTAYVVIERLDLTPFGNRLPQLSFEVITPMHAAANNLRAVNLIPGAGEAVLSPDLVLRTEGLNLIAENRHVLHATTDWEAAMDDLQACLPNLARVQLVVSWFGDDLRAGSCTLTPRVENHDKTWVGEAWEVAGQSRSQALAVSADNGRPAYGGTPSDAFVIKAVRDLKARGLEVILYPFVMMDIGETPKPNPHQPEQNQPRFPWRGQITCHPARGQAGSPEGTSACRSMVEAFFGHAEISHFNLQVERVTNTCPDQGYRRMILHYAHLAKAAGGVDGFILGSELVGLTHAQAQNATYPAVEQLMDLAADVRSVLGNNTKLTYAADWTEYGADVRTGGADVRFPLDELWASPHVDAVGIDFYPPLTDWREDKQHADQQATPHPCHVPWLSRALTRGEGYDWYYASEDDRRTQTRTLITDGAHNEPWVYRVKDLKNWWLHLHKPRLNGQQSAQPTAWQPASKPIWLTEIGCPALVHGTNGPHVFPDHRNTAAKPPFALNSRDDATQSAALEAMLAHYDPSHPLYVAGDNPQNAQGMRMVPSDAIAAWAYDARPYPAFPSDHTTWSDVDNWATGHWLNGRLENASLARLVTELVRSAGGAVDVTQLYGDCEGLVIDRPMSVRQALETLTALYRFDVVETAEGLRAISHAGRPDRVLTDADFALDDHDHILSVDRADSSEHPHRLTLVAQDPEQAYHRLAVSEGVHSTERVETLETGLTLSHDAALARLTDLWTAASTPAEEVRFTLSRQLAEMEPGDTIQLPDRSGLFQITTVTHANGLDIRARKIPPKVHAPQRQRKRQATTTQQTPIPELITVAVRGDPERAHVRAGVLLPSWTTSWVVFREGENEALLTFTRPATMGRLQEPLPAAPWGIWSHSPQLTLSLPSSTDLVSLSEEAVRRGAGRWAIEKTNGEWEIVQAQNATLVAENTWVLGPLLRGQQGTEDLVALTAEAGARAVRLDDAMVPLPIEADEVGTSLALRLVPASLDALAPQAQTVTTLLPPDALKPWPPVHPEVRRTTLGLQMTWVRRKASDEGGDYTSWTTDDVPTEAGSTTRIRIWQGQTLLRTVETEGSSWLYSASNEINDFGAPLHEIVWSLCAYSPAHGEGRSVTLTSPVAPSA